MTNVNLFSSSVTYLTVKITGVKKNTELDGSSTTLTVSVTVGMVELICS